MLCCVLCWWWLITLCKMKTQSQAFQSCFISILMCTLLCETQYDYEVKFDARDTHMKFVFQMCFTVNWRVFIVSLHDDLHVMIQAELVWALLHCQMFVNNMNAHEIFIWNVWNNICGLKFGMNEVPRVRVILQIEYRYISLWLACKIASKQMCLLCKGFNW